MIIVYHFSTIAIRQSQIHDFINPQNIRVTTIHRYRRVNFTKTIEICFRKRKPAKPLVQHRRKKLKQLTLGDA